MNAPQVYLILGAAGSGRRAVIADLVANGLEDGARPVLLLPANERPAAPEAEKLLADLSGLAVARWAPSGGSLLAPVPEGTTHIIMLSDGRANPVDQVEAFHNWLPMSGAELGRIITIVDCQLGSAHKGLLRWYDACVHFSDAVLLTKRDGVPSKWVSDFTARYHKQHFPCLIELVTKSGVENPAMILVPEARRISMFFDSEADWPAPDGETEVEEKAAVADGDLIGADDPYIERQAGSSRRAREIPDINKFLPA
jgi:hypothetical protein